MSISSNDSHFMNNSQNNDRNDCFFCATFIINYDFHGSFNDVLFPVYLKY